MRKPRFPLSPWTASQDSFASMGAAMLMAQRQVAAAVITAQFRMIEDTTRAVAEVQLDVLDAIVQAATRRD